LVREINYKRALDILVYSKEELKKMATILLMKLKRQVRYYMKKLVDDWIILAEKDVKTHQ
jgi:hypothetical protein